MGQGSVKMAAGREVTLLGPARGHAHPGRVRSWDVGEAGLVVTSTVAVAEEALRELAGQRVWVSSVPGPANGRDTGDDADDGQGEGVTVFAAVAQPSRPGELSLTGVVTLVADRRRKAARAEASEAVTVETRDHARANLRTVDLSRGGMRVATTAGADLHEGDRVHVEMNLGGDTTVPADGEVTRIDERSGQAVVRFLDVAAQGADDIDRFVLAWIASRGDHMYSRGDDAS